MEKEPSRICLRNRTISRTSDLETTSNGQNPQCKAKKTSVKTTTKNQDKPSSNKEDNNHRETRSSKKIKHLKQPTPKAHIPRIRSKSRINTSRKKIHNRSKSESDLSICFKSNKKEEQQIVQKKTKKKANK